MKFRSRKDILFQSIIFGLSLLAAGFMLYRFIFETATIIQVLTPSIVLILLLIPFIWAQFSTNYELTRKELIYKSGPIKGKIEIERIREIIKGKSLWVGLKPALARKGLIIKYDKYEEIYISPETNERFVKAILEINPEIKVVNAST
ncbi:MAG: PH domain-containing protein [Gramella sp.]|nr:PH domain-containing protein [Christiangramia sp.]